MFSTRERRSWGLDLETLWGWGDGAVGGRPELLRTVKC